MTVCSTTTITTLFDVIKVNYPDQGRSQGDWGTDLQSTGEILYSKFSYVVYICSAHLPEPNTWWTLTSPPPATTATNESELVAVLVLLCVIGRCIYGVSRDRRGGGDIYGGGGRGAMADREGRMRGG